MQQVGNVAARNEPFTWVICVFFLLLTTTARPAAVNFTNLDAHQGFNFNGTVHTNVGFITALTINSTALSADLIVENPVSHANMHVVGILDSESWDGTVAGTMQFHARVSTANKSTVTSILQNTLSTLNMQLNYEIFSYSNSYFESFSPLNNQPIAVVLQKNGTQPEISMAGTPNSDITSPQNYELGFTNGPSATVVDTLVYVTPSNRIVKAYGVFGSVVTVLPAVSGATATQITATGATLQETVNPGEGTTAVSFNYGTSPTLVGSTASTTNTLGAGANDDLVDITVSNLTPQTTYYYQAVAVNSAGTTTDTINSFVTTAVSVPGITGAALALDGTDLVIAGTNGTPGLSYYVLSTTNLLAPISGWTPVATNQFDGGGNFNLTLTNAVQAAIPQQLYLIESLTN